PRARAPAGYSGWTTCTVRALRCGVVQGVGVAAGWADTANDDVNEAAKAIAEIKGVRRIIRSVRHSHRTFSCLGWARAANGGHEERDRGELGHDGKYDQCDQRAVVQESQECAPQEPCDAEDGIVDAESRRL